MTVNILDDHYLAFTAIVTVGLQLAVYAVAATCKFDTLTDLAGSSNFVINAVLTLLLGNFFHTRQVVLTLAVVLWGLRLGGFLFYRVLKRKKDDRFDEIRNNPLSFLGFFVYQMFWVFICGLPVTIINGEDSNSPITALDVVGWTLFLVGFLLEAAADQQKYAFRQDPSNKGKWCDTGVWAWSRHPNYAGELLVWWGIWLSSLAQCIDTGPTWGVVGVASPLFITALLLALSGLPLGERSYDDRFGDQDAYWQYVHHTSILWPLPQAVYGAIPGPLKTVFCCEFPCYRAPRKERTVSTGDHYGTAPTSEESGP